MQLLRRAPGAPGLFGPVEPPPGFGEQQLDLARVGRKYADVWHYKHMIDPREISPGSNMPPYAHLKTETIDFANTEVKLRAMRNIGVPYKAEQIQMAEQNAQAAATAIAAGLATDAGVKVCDAPAEGCELLVNSRLVALISYLQRLGRIPEAEALAAVETTEVE